MILKLELLERNQTHKLVFINYKGFKSFIEWKTRNRFK
ncbi:excisionase [Streptococcus phage CHPC951]|uniref:Uncharacterized protein n=1 Tax=Streptococcus phage CHPC951 TaxID=2365055 RepID=A0A3G8F8Q4_9CAUD|nr:excisionase [Streptococcus phage CHPC951]AZF91119.1 hypothetical protein CHPC951_0031 [Streptococcus phage CHPC951]